MTSKRLAATDQIHTPRLTELLNIFQRPNDSWVTQIDFRYQVFFVCSDSFLPCAHLIGCQRTVLMREWISKWAWTHDVDIVG